MQCRSGYTLQENSCWAPCPNGTSPAKEDYTKCVLDVSCGFGMTQDPVFDLQCNKVGFPKDVSCSVNYYEWRSSQCFINCPSETMLENGLTCIKKSLNRSNENPTCAFLCLVWGSDCVLNPLSFFLVFVLFTFVVYKLFYTTKPKKFSF
jgi:hypothetical protein